MDKAAEKKNLRKTIREFQKSLTPSYLEEASRDICRRALSMEEYRRAETIFCYVGRKEEVDTMPIIIESLKQGKRVGVPKCVARGIMEVYRIGSPEDLEPGSFGIREPKAGTSLIRPEEIELSFIPCLSCSSDGKRLGYGGGYYDRYLEKVSGVNAVLCPKKLMCEEIPMEEHDRKIGIVINEEGTVR
jgi:5-formyltetrahydrofolate cyclo-ligase